MQPGFPVEGIMVESTLTFTDPGNTDFGFTGEKKDDELLIRPDAVRTLAYRPPRFKGPSREDLSDCTATLRRK
jgi:hypothetical protein